jgi:hypothetical protein
LSWRRKRLERRGTKTQKKIKIVRIIARLNVGDPARHVVCLTEAMNDGDEFESVLIGGRVHEGEEDMSYSAAQHRVIPNLSRRDEPRTFAERYYLFLENLLLPDQRKT